MSREPFRPRTPAPLKTSQTPNLGLQSPPSLSSGRPFAPDSPTALLAPKEGSVKIKVKAGVSPEARSRVGATALASGLRPVTPRPVRSRLGATTPTPVPDVPARYSTSTPSSSAAAMYARAPAASSKLASSMRRAPSPSGSEESLSAYAGEGDQGVMDAAMGQEAEELHEHETVLVSVRCVAVPIVGQIGGGLTCQGTPVKPRRAAPRGAGKYMGHRQLESAEYQAGQVYSEGRSGVDVR